MSPIFAIQRTGKLSPTLLSAVRMMIAVATQIRAARPPGWVNSTGANGTAIIKTSAGQKDIAIIRPNFALIAPAFSAATAPIPSSQAREGSMSNAPAASTRTHQRQ